MIKTCSARKVWLPQHGQWAHFTHRDVMRRNRPKRARAAFGAERAVPVTPVPIDGTGNATVACPMDKNDSLGICGPAMIAHLFNIRTFGQGHAGFTEWQPNLDALVAQYEKYSGGDNGTDETMLVGPGGMATAGVGLAGDPTAIVVDHLDIDINDLPLRNFCVDQFYAVDMAWSVPDDFLQKFTQGSVWDNADTPDPNNGHFTLMADVDSQNRIRCWTWGSWCWMSPAFVASVDPECFVTFSAHQFNRATGYDSKGRHVGDVAAAWVSIGGNASAVAAVVGDFPPKAAPAPPPAPQTGAPTLALAQQWAAAGINADSNDLMTKAQAITAANAGLAQYWTPQATPS